LPLLESSFGSEPGIFRRSEPPQCTRPLCALNSPNTQAIQHCNQVYSELVRDKADLYHRVRLMVLKADIFAVSAIQLPSAFTASD